MNQCQIICGMKPLKCPLDKLFDRYRNRSRISFVISTIGEIIKSIKKDDVIPPLSDTKTMPELAKQCQNVRVKYVLSRNFVISTQERSHKEDKQGE
jgi:hypothetical protein